MNNNNRKDNNMSKTEEKKAADEEEFDGRSVAAMSIRVEMTRQTLQATSLLCTILACLVGFTEPDCTG